MNTATQPRPWYRERMVWMLIAIPMSAVVMGVIMITLAVKTWDGLVVDDYYKHGKEINRLLVRDQYAAEMGISANLQIGEAGNVSVALDSRQPVEKSQVLTLRIMHPTQAGLDMQTELALGPDNRYHGVVSQLKKSDWIVQLETETWRLNQRIRVSDSKVSTLMEAPDA